jgi:hypothetical protein
MACVTITLPAVIASGTVPGTSASPGFQFGRAGDVAAGTYLQVVATVPTNTAGLIVPFTGVITSAWTTNEAVNTYTLKVQRRVGAGFVDQGLSLPLVAARLVNSLFSVPVVAGQELVMLLDTGSGRNIQAGLIIEQNP